MSVKVFRIFAHLLIFVCLTALFLMGSTALAEESAPTVPGAIQADDSILEVGAWYVQDYDNCPPYGLNDLSGTRRDAYGARDTLTAKNFVAWFPYPSPIWTSRYSFGDAWAWEEDWKRSANGGTEWRYIDTVDLAYFSGHGHKDFFFFGKNGKTHDDCFLTKSDAYAAWGTNDLDWAVISACQVLNDPYSSYRYWARAMAGIRLIIGMKTNMSDVPAGEDFARYVRWNNTFTYSWFRMANNLLPSDEVARVMAEHPAYFNDTWQNHDDPTTVDNYFSLATHRAKTPIVAVSAASLGYPDLSALDGEMPVFKVQPLSTGEADQRWEALGATFGLTDTQPITDVVSAGGVDSINATSNLYVSQDGDLVMDRSAGLYQFADSDLLWNFSLPVPIPVRASMMTNITPEDAQGIAEAFLESNEMLPSDARFSEVAVDTVTHFEDPARFAGAAEAAATPLNVLAEEDVNYVVTWSRVISYTPPSVGAAAINEPIQFEVVGPGARIDVFVDTTAPAHVMAQSQLANTLVQGNKGGYRNISTVTAAGANGILTTPVLPVETIKTLYEKIPEKVALGYAPIPAENTEIVGVPRRGYWEGPINWNLDQLIPTYILDVRATSPEVGSADMHEEYVPVHNQYMAPYAEIIAPDDVESALPGTTLTFEAADASKTLAELGVDPSLDFVLGTGDPDSYLYDWYQDDVSSESKLGSGRSLEYTVADAASTDGKPLSIKIILVVTDSSSPRDPMTSNDELPISFTRVFMPSILN